MPNAKKNIAGSLNGKHSFHVAGTLASGPVQKGVEPNPDKQGQNSLETLAFRCWRASFSEQCEAVTTHSLVFTESAARTFRTIVLTLVAALLQTLVAALLRTLVAAFVHTTS